MESKVALFCSNLIIDDLLLEILKRLPIKTLFRFLSVSTSWESLISSSLFVNLHHSVQSAAPPDTKPYLRTPNNRDDYISYLLHRSYRRTQLHFPFLTDRDNHSSTFFDVINGVICLSYSFDSSFDCTVLWNPSILKYVILPWLPFTLDVKPAKRAFLADIDANVLQSGAKVANFVNQVKFQCSFAGFGYDAPNHDFKVVRVWIPCDNFVQKYCKSIPPTYEVYSSRVGIWKAATSDLLKNCTFYDRVTSKTGCFVNGTIHWIIQLEPDGKKGQKQCARVLMFDFKVEEFRIFDLPLAIFDSISSMVDLTEYAGMLAVVVDSLDNPLDPTAFYVDMWVMEEHGVAASWKKLYRFHDIEFHEWDRPLYHVYDNSYRNLAPYGPINWFKRGSSWSYVHRDILSHHVYEETLFLMDDAEAESYAMGELVRVTN